MNSFKKITERSQVFGLEVPFCKISLHDGTHYVDYDIGSLLYEEKSVQPVRKWLEESTGGLAQSKRIEHRSSDCGGTQLYYAKKGIVTPEMDFVATRESQKLKAYESI
ncbi:MAG TPA: hypothetical protein VFZ52_08960, partial [Chryseolinea sp.]